MSTALALALLLALPQALPALARDPRTLPVAPAERWLEWKPKDEVPERLRPRLGEGMRAYAEADFARALECFVALLESEPDYPPALYQTATTYFRLRRYGDCVVVMERFLRAAPGEIGATQALGHGYYSLGRYGEAREHYAKVVAAAPASVEAWRGLGLANLRLGELDRALECLDKALELRPEHAEAHSWRATVLLDLGRTDEALAAAERARDLAPYEPRNWFQLAQIYGELGRDQAAEGARARFVELNHLEQEIRAQEGLLLHDARALEPLRRLIVLQRAVGNAGEAREALHRLLRAAPADLSSHTLALETLHALGDAKAAQQVAAGIETRFADRAEGWKVLADFYAACGDREGRERAEERQRALGGGK